MRTFLILIILFLPVYTFAQTQRLARGADAGLFVRQVSGMVQDSIGNPVSGASIKLVSDKDSISASTDNEGIFIFENIKKATFTITLSAIGYGNLIRRYLNNEQSSKIVLEPITLHAQTYLLGQVTVNGKPTITYKTDTVEYRASDYKVPAQARVDELLKRMEGMEVGRDGSLTHQGQSVTKAKLNGREFGTGDVAQAIQNLPASIVEKIQVVDDYGDQAARTGIKDGDPRKVLNITTKAEKSIGSIASITSQIGNHGRYNQQVSAQNINANRLINFTGNLSSTVNGIASQTSNSSLPNSNRGRNGNLESNANSGSTVPGTTKSGSPVFSYTNSWNNKVILTGSYSYNFNNTDADNNSYGQRYTSIGSSIFTNQSNSVSKMRGHEVKLQLDYTIDKSNFIQFIPYFNTQRLSNNIEALTKNFNYYTSGFEHQLFDLASLSPSNSQTWGLTGLYVHNFTKPKRNLSVQFSFSRADNGVESEKLANYRYFRDTTQNDLLKDSLSHLSIRKSSDNNTIRGLFTYVEPLNSKSQLEFASQVRRSSYSNAAAGDTIQMNYQRSPIPGLTNLFQFSFTEFRTSVNYRLNIRKSSLSIGAAALPASLSGNGISSPHGSTSQFKIIPVFRYVNNISSAERVQITYAGSFNEPSYQQLQPFIDPSDPNNILVGNPALRPTFNHTLLGSYNRYFPNQKFNLSFNLSGRMYEDQVTTNITQIIEKNQSGSSRSFNQIEYKNVSGDYNVATRYSISKQLSDYKYHLMLNGNVSYNVNNSFSNGIKYQTNVWNFSQRLGPRISFKDERFVINPYIGYEFTKSSASSLNSQSNNIEFTRLAIEGRCEFGEDLIFRYDAMKNFISGLSNYGKNPFIINAGFEKRFFKNRSLALTLDIFDLLHQNNFIQQIVTPISTTYTYSSTLSRFFLLGLKLNLQKWGGTPKRNGKPMKRRGDGSFIN